MLCQQRRLQSLVRDKVRVIVYGFVMVKVGEKEKMKYTGTPTY